MLTFFLSTFIGFSTATEGVDLSTASNEWSCLHSTDGFDFSICRAWKSYGAFDSTSITNLNNAAKAGVPYNDVYLFPCRGKSAASQVDAMIADLASGLNGGPIHHNYPLASNDKIAPGLKAGYSQSKTSRLIRDGFITNMTELKKHKDIPKWRQTDVDATYGMIWMDIENNPSSGCGWGKDYSSNCEYLQQLLSAVVAKGKKPGVYSSLGEWEQVMGSKGGCTAVKNYPLWYAHYDGNPSFSDWSSMQFGGWSSPAMKQFQGTTTKCSTGVDLNWY
eukprot:51105_1